MKNDVASLEAEYRNYKNFLDHRHTQLFNTIHDTYPRGSEITFDKGKLGSEGDFGYYPKIRCRKKYVKGVIDNWYDDGEGYYAVVDVEHSGGTTRGSVFLKDIEGWLNGL